jgi:hypothetical protein
MLSLLSSDDKLELSIGQPASWAVIMEQRDEGIRAPYIERQP